MVEVCSGHAPERRIGGFRALGQLAALLEEGQWNSWHPIHELVARVARMAEPLWALLAKLRVRDLLIQSSGLRMRSLARERFFRSVAVQA